VCRVIRSITELTLYQVVSATPSFSPHRDPLRENQLSSISNFVKMAANAQSANLLDVHTAPEMQAGQDGTSPVGVKCGWKGVLSAAIAIVFGVILIGVASLGMLLPIHGPQLAHSPGISDQDPTAADVLLSQLRNLHGKEPAQASALHLSAGHLYRGQGQLTKAIFQYEASLDLATQSDGKVAALIALGNSRLQQGHMTQAKEDLEKAIVLDDSHGEFAVSAIHALANVYRNLGNFKEAIKRYHQAWKLAKASEAVDSTQLPLIAADAGETYARLGQQSKAFFWLKQAQKEFNFVERNLRRPSVDQPEEAQIQSVMGSTYHQAGQVQKAMNLYRKALQVQTRLLYPGHTDLIATRLGMARAQRDLGDLDGAKHTVEAVEKVLQQSALEGPDMSRCLLLKADFLRESKEYKLAESTILLAISQQDQWFGSGPHPEKGVALLTYGSILHDEGKFQEAHTQYLKALKMNIATVGDWHPETASTHNSLGTLYEDTNNLAAAEEHFEQCLQIQLRSVGTASPDVANTYNNLGTNLYRQGAIKRAVEMLKKALKVLDAAGVPSTNPERLIFKDNLNQAMQSMREGKPEHANAQTH